MIENLYSLRVNQENYLTLYYRELVVERLTLLKQSSDILERLGVVLINGSDAIDNVKDKLYSQQILGQSNLPSKNYVGKASD